MKGYPRPLSEVFVYGSPERPATGSFRWVGRKAAPVSKRKRRQQEVPHVDRHKH